MAGLRSNVEDDVEDNLEQFINLLRWTDTVLVLLGAIIVILVIVAWLSH
jgi:hypothetical protein